MEEKEETEYLWSRRKQSTAGVEECTWMSSGDAVGATFRTSTGLAGLRR